MTTKRWLVLTLALIVGIGGGFALLNYLIDPYGLFRDAHGRIIPVFANERTTKYLLGYNYIPSNFDGVLIGSSISGNWNTAKFRRFRVYNASLSGGNASEAKLIMDNILAQGKIRLAIFIIHRAMAEDHGPKSGYMNRQEYWGSLGSIQVLQNYWAQLLNRAGRHRNEADGFGVYDISDEIVRFEEQLKSNSSQTATVVNMLQKQASGAPEHADEIAVAEYRELVEKARANGAMIVGVIPPRFNSSGVARAERDAYEKRLLSAFAPSDLVVDLDSPQFNNLRQSPSNYWDGLHLTDKAADDAIAAIDRSIEDCILRSQP